MRCARPSSPIQGLTDLKVSVANVLVQIPEYLQRSYGGRASMDQSCFGGTKGTNRILNVALMLLLVSVRFQKMIKN